MARKWAVGDEVQAQRLNKTGNGFDTLSNTTYDASGQLTQFLADGFYFRVTYDASGNITLIERWDSTNTTKLEDWVMTYDTDSNLLTETNNNYASIL